VTPGRATYREAVREALGRALASDPRVLLLGEDVGRYGGAYAASAGLLERFGPARVRDTPLSEAGFVGAAIGAAIGGLRPIVEIMTVNFSLLAIDQLVNGAATLRHMSNGQVAVPLVVRMATGAGRQLAAQHSHSLEGWYAHVPGLKVLTSSTPQDARDAVLAALADPDPVIVFEPQILYPSEGAFDPEVPVGDVWRAAVRRVGDDVTIVAFGGSTPKALAAAEALAAEGTHAEVVELRALRPFDRDAIVRSVEKTGRLVVVDEAWRTGSFAGEIVASIAEQALYELDAPPARVCSAEVPIPYPKHLEDAALPSVERIVRAAREVVGSHA
jgi:pyruvate dehydrogenase E1 component beta subunit